jgi:hypothetical protein
MTTIYETSDELGIAYLLALDELRAAETGLLHAVTVTQEESAATWLRRVAAHVRYCKEELLSHCARHGCPVPVPGLEVGGVLRREAGAARSWAGGVAA